VTVRFHPSRYVPPQKAVQNVTERQQRVLAFLAEHSGGVALREIVVAFGDAEASRQLREDLATLKTLGLAESSGHGRGARWTLA
jgi:ATP-dependent DNA helicase RecG